MSSKRALTLLAALMCLSALPGCNIAGPLFEIASGPPSADAEHELIDRPTVVYVDDRANKISSNARVIRLAIADKVSEDLMVKKVLNPLNTISPRDAMGIVSRQDRHSSLMSIDAIGRAVGAEQVIYIEMQAFSPTSFDGITPRPTSACSVRVIDVVEQKRLFPAPDATERSRTVQANTLEIDPSLLRSPSTRLKVFQALADETGSKIGKLFYRHEIREIGERLGYE